MFENRSAAARGSIEDCQVVGRPAADHQVDDRVDQSRDDGVALVDAIARQTDESLVDDTDGR